jgi:hypothetical protein
MNLGLADFELLGHESMPIFLQALRLVDGPLHSFSAGSKNKFGPRMRSNCLRSMLMDPHRKN